MIAVLLALVTATAAAADAPSGLVTSPRYTSPLPYLGVPPQLEDRLIYYRSFDAPGGRAEVDPLPLTEQHGAVPAPAGWSGLCGLTGDAAKGSLRLSGAALSPHLPLTIMFWWSIPTALPQQAGYSLVGLTGHGWISLFGRGGPWCGLTDTAAVLQIWDVPGVVHVNNIYDSRIRQNLDMTAWHHGALTVTGGKLVRWYVDGKLVTESPLEGAVVTEAAQLTNLELGAAGPPTTRLDDVMILRRTLSESEVRDYVSAAQALRAVGRR